MTSLSTTVLDHLAELVMRREAGSKVGALVLRQIDAERETAAIVELPAASLAAHAYAAAGGVGDAPRSLLAACVSVYLGADVLDEVADRELPPAWLAHGPDQATLAGVALLGPVAGFAIAALDAAPATRLAMREALDAAVAEMIDGQSLDLASEADDDVTRARCEQIALGKSGAQGDFYARAAAIAAGAPPTREAALASIGRNLATSLQLHSDAVDLLAPIGVGKDLRRRKRTLPVVHALATLDGDARARLSADLAAAPEDPDRERAARDAIVAAGGVLYAALVARLFRRRALAAWRQLDPVLAAALGRDLEDREAP